MENLPDDIVVHILENENWDPFLVGTISCISKRFLKLAKETLWPNCFAHHNPRLAETFLNSNSQNDNFESMSRLGKFLGYCPGVSGVASEVTGTRSILFPPHRVPPWLSPEGHIILKEEFLGDDIYLSNCDHSIDSSIPGYCSFRAFVPNFENSR